MQGCPLFQLNTEATILNQNILLSIDNRVEFRESRDRVGVVLVQGAHHLDPSMRGAGAIVPGLPVLALAFSAAVQRL